MMEPALAAVETVAAGPRSGFLSTSWSDEESAELNVAEPL
jgi:hypothetical protein